MQVLQDPDRMQQITEMASAMGLNTPSEERTQEPTVFKEAMQQISQVLHQTEAKDRKQQTLMRALLPYLSPARQKKLERAMQLSHLSRLAGAAMSNGSLTSFLSDEGEFHV